MRVGAWGPTPLAGNCVAPFAPLDREDGKRSFGHTGGVITENCLDHLPCDQ